MERKTQQELSSLIIDAINDNRLNNKPVSEIHYEVFNTDYFIIGYYQAEQWLIANGGIFNAIETIKDYENDNFGEVTTDFSSSEKVCNMFVYILGEEIINSLKVIQDCWDAECDDDILKELKIEIENL